jgi:hypothetical protein
LNLCLFPFYKIVKLKHSPSQQTDQDRGLQSNHVLVAALVGVVMSSLDGPGQ